MKVLIASMSTLFIEALQAVIRERRSSWQVDIYPLQAPILTQAFMKKVKEQSNDIVVIETTNHDCMMIMESLKKIKGLEMDIMLLVDSRIGEVYHQLKSEERWTSVTKNTSLDEFLELLEAFTGNVPDKLKVSLQEGDERILKDLAVGHTFEYIQHTHGLSIKEIDQSLYRINAHFKTANYIESIAKAFEQKFIQ